MCSFLRSLVTSYLLGPNVFPSTLFPNTFNLFSSLDSRDQTLNQNIKPYHDWVNLYGQASLNIFQLFSTWNLRIDRRIVYNTQRKKERKKKATKKLTNQPTPWSRVLLEKLTCSQLVKKFPAFYGTRRFTAAFKSSRHLSLSWARSNHSTPFVDFNEEPIQNYSPIYALIFPCILFPLRLPTKTLYASFISFIRATCPSLLINHYFNTPITFVEKYQS